tara:strand:+ start:6543 stop:7013 length:471 start_codon:yes stop_codon:yes gene_type:complete
MSFHKHNSWGRTRSPKNIAGPPGTEVVVEANTNSLLSGATDYKLAGYATQNQRYLHILITDKNQSAPAAVTIFGYCHAFERWFEIEAQTTGTAVSAASANTAPTAASITVADSGRAPGAQVPSDTEYRTYEIAGIDRVAFVGVTANVSVFAACSTF